MRQAEAGTRLAGFGGAERRRVATVMETLSTMRTTGESAAELAHDARNMVTALRLYCELLQEPGVLAAPFRHYGGELQLLATASGRLVEKLVMLERREAAVEGARRTEGRVGAARWSSGPDPDRRSRGGQWEELPAAPIADLAAELLVNRNLLAALAGRATAVNLTVEEGSMAVNLTGEDLTRVLVNLVKNASEAMPGGGQIHISLRERCGAAETADESEAQLVLSVEDSGPGIPPGAGEAIFEPGFTTHTEEVPEEGAWPVAHRGLGLSISRSIVEAAGGRIHAFNQEQGGACFEIELPARTRR